jgi:hypothetical protein
MKGKWAQGIVPRNFAWVIKDQLAVCERPGGYGVNHRKVRRQEEIIWVREQGFTQVLSMLPSPHNLHAYDELGVEWRHVPFGPHDDARARLTELYGVLQELLEAGGRVLVHQEELGDLLQGSLAGYLVHTGMVPEGPRAIAILEQIVQRQMGPQGRQLVALAADL